MRRTIRALGLGFGLTLGVLVGGSALAEEITLDLTGDTSINVDLTNATDVVPDATVNSDVNVNALTDALNTDTSGTADVDVNATVDANAAVLSEDQNEGTTGVANVDANADVNIDANVLPENQSTETTDVANVEADLEVNADANLGDAGAVMADTDICLNVGVLNGATGTCDGAPAETGSEDESNETPSTMNAVVGASGEATGNLISDPVTVPVNVCLSVGLGGTGSCDSSSTDDPTGTGDEGNGTPDTTNNVVDTDANVDANVNLSGEDGVSAEGNVCLNVGVLGANAASCDTGSAGNDADNQPGTGSLVDANSSVDLGTNLNTTGIEQRIDAGVDACLDVNVLGGDTDCAAGSTGAGDDTTGTPGLVAIGLDLDTGTGADLGDDGTGIDADGDLCLEINVLGGTNDACGDGTGTPGLVDAGVDACLDVSLGGSGSSACATDDAGDGPGDGDDGSVDGTDDGPDDGSDDGSNDGSDNGSDSGSDNGSEGGVDYGVGGDGIGGDNGSDDGTAGDGGSDDASDASSNDSSVGQDGAADGTGDRPLQGGPSGYVQLTPANQNAGPAPSERVLPSVMPATGQPFAAWDTNTARATGNRLQLLLLLGLSSLLAGLWLNRRQRISN